MEKFDCFRGLYASKVKKEAKFRQQDEEWIGKAIGASGLLVYRAVEERRRLDELEQDLFLPEEEFYPVVSKLQEKGVFKITDEQGAERKIEGGAISVESLKYGKAGLDAAICSDGIENVDETRKRVFGIWGEEGVKIYSAIDGEMSVAEIARKAGVSEAEAMRFVDCMEKEGVVGFERERKHPDRIVPRKYLYAIEMPVIWARGKGGVFGYPLVFFGVARFGVLAWHLFRELTSEGRDSAAIAAKRSVSIEKVEEILDFFAAKGIADVERVNAKKAVKLFGGKAAGVYMRFGREGILVHRLVEMGKTTGEVIKESGLAPARAAEIIAFINKVYGAVGKEGMEKYDKFGLELEERG
ncbi:hypothetical protein AUJ17_03480 [Candidatus Micrarchaeota archaeon CG1_02_47_40]|nr:MAG: hypothetical protein AUJ17_03480 [Candidatus Micrarchaeota archaeon CG1_02_47_40]